MRSSTLVALTLVLLALAPPHTTSAQDPAPIQLSLLSPAQLVPADEAIRGLRLSLLYGRNTDVTGLDVGLVAHSTGDFRGVQLAVVGLTDNDFTGLQYSLVSVITGHMEGVQLGGVNLAESGRGIQWGAVNHSRNFRGLQLSLVNYAETLHGIQVGLVNIIREGGVLPVMPIVNWSFDND